MKENFPQGGDRRESKLTQRELENQDKFIEGMTYSELAGIKYDKLTDLKAHVSNNSGNNEWYTPENYIESARELSC